MKTLLLSIALMAFLFVSCDKSQAPTASQGTAMSKATVDREYDVDLGCGQFCADCPECICLTGRIQVVSNKNGIHVNYTLTGTGTDCTTGVPTGTTYHGSLNANISANGSLNETLNIHSNDGGCDFKLHVTFNSNGEMTSYHTTCD